MQPNTLDVVVGGQFGSESKGRVTAALAVKRRAEGRTVYTVRVAGPNAGHVVIDDNGNRFALRTLPVGLVVDPRAVGVIAAGSEIDYQVLRDEVEDLERAGHEVRSRLLIDGQATMLEESHRNAEGGNDGPMQTRMGSTGKGIGAARADRIWRTAKLAGSEEYWGHLSEFGLLTDTARVMQPVLQSGNRTAILIEGTQGYGLGLHAGYYPFCTSSDCRAIDFLAMAGLSPWAHPNTQLTVHVVARAYPIRVAGNSGELQHETTWAELGLPEEYTTVTHKVRRVGHWDGALVRDAVKANGGPSEHVVLHLAMADQRIPELADHDQWVGIDPRALYELGAWVEKVERETGARVMSVGTGPRSTLWTAERYHGSQTAMFEGLVTALPKEVIEQVPADAVSRIKAQIDRRLQEGTL